MELLSQIIVSRPEGDASIQLLYGDLTAIPSQFAVDILAISAFRNDYRTNRNTLMSALFTAGISVANLAKDKEIDLVSQLSCWLSKPLSEAQQARFNIKKILCFEPVGPIAAVETEVGNLFRGINTFAIDENHNEIAMPVLTTGDRGFPLEVMLPALLDTAIFWLESGLPLTSLKFVLHRPEQVQKGLPIFENARTQYALKQSAETGQISAETALREIDVQNSATSGGYVLPKLAFTLQQLAQVETGESPPDGNARYNFDTTENLSDVDRLRGFDTEENLTEVDGLRGFDLQESLPAIPIPKQYDYFISYSHKHTAAVQEFVNALQARNPLLTVFYDRDSIPTGGLWIKMISDAIQNSKNVICILTPEYSTSAVCWDEFQCAYVMEKRKKLMIRTINFCNDADLPPMIAIYSYIDCTEADIEKLKGAVETLVAS